VEAVEQSPPELVFDVAPPLNMKTRDANRTRPRRAPEGENCSHEHRGLALAGERGVDAVPEPSIEAVAEPLIGRQEQGAEDERAEMRRNCARGLPGRRAERKVRAIGRHRRN